MERIQHDLVQGGDEWIAFRLNHHGASEAAAMLGISKKASRSELLRIKHTGMAKEFGDWVQKNILDYGHEVEALARPIAEARIDEDLFPVTYSYGKLSASCDGLTMAGIIAFEHKQWSAELAASVARGELPEEHQPQCQQIMYVTGAEKVLFVVSDGTEDNFVSVWVFPDPAWVDRIVRGWAQFDIDLANYQHVEAAPEIVAAPIEDLPALMVEMVGQVTRSNLATFQAVVLARIKAINTDIQTDEDFANAEKMVKFLDDGEKRLDLVKAQALAQTSTIDELFRTLDSLKGEMKSKRLTLDKLVKTRKDTIRIEKQQAGKEKLAAHIASLNKRLVRVQMPIIAADFAGAMKNKRNISALDGAVADTLAAATIEANRIADLIQINLGTLDAHAEHAFLFHDLAGLCMKASDDLAAIIANRINAHKEAEAKKAEAAKARSAAQEMSAKLELARQAAQRQERYDVLKAVADKKPRILDKLTRDRGEVLAWQVKVDDAKAKTAGAKAGPLACPHCAGLLNLSHGVLVPYEEPAVKYDAEAAAALPEYEKALALFKASVASGERDLRQAEDAALQMAAIFPTDEERKAA